MVEDTKLQRSPLQNSNFVITLSVGFVLGLTLKIAGNIQYKFKSSQASKAILLSSNITGAKQNLTQKGHSRSFKITCFGVSGKAIRD